LLVFSDVHLGSDLNDSGPTVPRSVVIDRDLAALLAHYRKVTPPANRWRVIVAGDFIDFAGMSIDARAGDVLETELSATERKYGLGGAEDHVRLKLKRALSRHPDVFAELAAFVGDGHALTLIHGNHDLELYWDVVKSDFCALLASPAASAAEIAARVDFEPWFFYREGFVFIEHGHQYDPFCATPFIMAPLSPRDPRRVASSLSDTLLRYIVRRTPGMKEYGHEDRGLASYISWGLMLGARGTVGLFLRFMEAVRDLRRTARAYLSPDGVRVREEHERRLLSLARSSKVPADRLHAALALHATSMGWTPRSVLASVMLDRLGIFFFMIAALLTIACLWGRLGGYGLHVAGALSAVWLLLHVQLSRARPNVDPAAVMVDRAADLAKLFPSSFIVMGHTHVPATKSIGSATYINLGSWAEEEPDPNEDAAKAYRAARTHLVVHAREDRNDAYLCEWRSGEGPRELSVMSHSLVPAARPDDAKVAPPPRIAS
jgi:UDP-2,3-diacylglucosamine pyrophosphatase LpxH